MTKLLLATWNKGKAREIRSILKDLPLEIVSAWEIGTIPQLKKIRETGKTFAQNASIKAKAFAKTTHLLTLADDSGLEVDALGGQPGIHSARFTSGSDKLRFQKVLKLLKKIPQQERRTARFKAVVAICDPASGETKVFEGTTEGWITRAPQGKRGFGYDPIFYCAELGKTFGQADLWEKNRVSHRSRALEKAKAYLRKCCENEKVV